jgi:TrmH family RNA methyltransferase
MFSKSEIKSLNALKIKKYRHSEGLFIAEGPKILHDFLLSGHIPEKVYYTEQYNEAFKELPESVLQLVTEDELKRVSSLMQPQGCLAVFRIPQYNEIHESGWIMALDNIQDPGNMGTLIRIADWFGINDIVCSEDTVDCYNPKVVQATMGSLARIKIHYKELSNWLPHSQRKVFGGVLDGVDIRQIKFPEKGILLIGNEGNGISEELLPFIHQGITIPRLGQAESLNAGVAAGIMAAMVCWQFFEK